MNFEMMQKSFSGIFSVFNPTQPHIPRANQEAGQKLVERLTRRVQQMEMESAARVTARNTMQERMRDWPDYLPAIGR